MDDLSWLLTNGAELMEGFCVSHLILCVSELCLMSFVSVCVCLRGKRVTTAAQPSSAHSL